VNNLECLNEESFLEQDYFYSFKADDVHVPEPTSENLSQLSKTISVKEFLNNEFLIQ